MTPSTLDRQEVLDEVTRGGCSLFLGSIGIFPLPVLSFGGIFILNSAKHLRYS